MGISLPNPINVIKKAVKTAVKPIVKSTPNIIKDIQKAFDLPVKGGKKILTTATKDPYGAVANPFNAVLARGVNPAVKTGLTPKSTPSYGGAGLSPQFIQDKKNSELLKLIKPGLDVLYKPAGLTPEFIAEKKREQIQREALKALANVSTKSKSGGTSTKKKSSSSSGGSGTATPAPAPTGPSVTDLLNNLYDNLLKEIDTQNASTASDYDTTKQTITNQYSQAQKDLYAKYQATMNPLAAQAANLGVDYQNSSINDLADSSMKRLQETGDLSLASDQSYLDKMKLMQQGAFGALKTGSLQEKADAQLQYQMYLANLAAQAAAAKSGGGGGGSKKKGGGGGGGSGGSGGVKGTATQTGTSIDTGIPGLINSLYASGQNDLANNVGRYYDIYNEGALSAAMKDATSFTPTKQKKVTQNLSFFNKKVMDKYKKQAATNVANRKGTTFINTAAQVANALRPNTKQYGGVIYNNKVTRSAKGF